MRKFAKAIAVGAVVAPVILGGATVASAHDGPSYKHDYNSATVFGGTRAEQASGFDEDGNAYFEKARQSARPWGAYGHQTSSRS